MRWSARRSAISEDLEIQLNEALGKGKHLKAAGGGQRDELTAFFAAEAFDELAALCRDLPALFYATTLPIAIARRSFGAWSSASL